MRARTRRQLTLATALGGALVLAVAPAALAAKKGAGNLDGKFGNHGKTLTAISAPAPTGPIAMDSGGPETFVIALAEQPSGKLIAMGFHNEPGVDGTFYALARYVDGVLDPTFGTDGTVVFSPGNGTPAGMVVQSDGRIVVAGSLDTSTTGCQADFLVQRLTVDGAPDSTFGTGGQTITDFGGCDGVGGVALGAADSIIVTGFTGAFQTDVAVARYSANGTPDASFGAGGAATAPGLGVGQSVVVQSSGRVVVGANFEGDFRLVGFTSGGVLDATFADGGWNSTYFGDNDSALLADIALRGDGGIVAVGGNHDFDVGQFNIAIAAYDAAGDLDAGFGSGGLVQTHVAANFGEDQAGGVALQPDGRIVVAGWSCDANCDFIVARYLATGALDGAFGRGGIVTTGFASGSGDLARPVLIQADGKIIAGGQSDALPTGSSFALARYKG